MDIRNVTKETLINAIKNNKSLRTAILSIGCSGTQSQYKFIRNFIEDNNICVEHHSALSDRSNKVLYDTLNVLVNQDIVDQSDCFKDVAIKIGVCEKEDTLHSTEYRVLKQIIVENKKLNTSHFTFTKGGNSTIRYSNDEIFVENSTVSSQTLKTRYLKYREENNIPYQCDIMECGIQTWVNRKINLQLDHINGTNNDNRLENLRLLCPNCHSMTITYSGRRNSYLKP